MAAPIQFTSTITCPACGCKQTETMPEAACMHFYVCPACHRMLRPLAGDCCVFCSFGSFPCPPVQRACQDSSHVRS
ncbi:MAG TPA: GDCCVxC domain-containing (seleno)protein [Oleiagrimonas sp.]|nr:GDCCVxC domain-containing (seleno)protein [Oleiagrimonas sp.]